MPRQSKLDDDQSSNPVTRKRKLPGRVHSAEMKYGGSPISPLVYDCRGKQVTVSEGHPWKSASRKGGPDQDIGGDFYTTKSYMIGGGNFSHVKLFRDFVGIEEFELYNGPITATGWCDFDSEGVLKANFPPTFEKSISEMDELGAIAVDRCKPGQPIANLATALGELIHDGLPTIPGLSLLSKGPRDFSGSSEYLNFQFGIQPLINDAQKFLKGVRNSDEYITQLKRDNGRRVRRRYYFPDESSTSVLIPAWNPSGPLPSDNIAGGLRSKYHFSGGTAEATRDISRKASFSGSFTYYLPDNFGEGLHGLSDKLDAVFGTELSLSTIWNLAPWSWAIDWFSSAGSTLSNAEDILSHALVMHYGYLMVTTTVTDTYTFRWPDSSSDRLRVSDVILVTQTKQRRRANPFGFGANWEGLSPFQLSIAAALGINRR